MECLKLEVDCIDDVRGLDPTTSVKGEDEKEWKDSSLQETVQRCNAGVNGNVLGDNLATCRAPFKLEDVITIAPVGDLLMKDETFTGGSESTDDAPWKLEESSQEISACDTDACQIDDETDPLETAEENPAAAITDLRQAVTRSSLQRCSVMLQVIQPLDTSSNPEFHTRQHSSAHTSEHCGETFTDSTDTDALTMKQSDIKHVKPFHCKICGRGFTRSTSLKQHMLIHSGEKPYRCKICSRGFTRSTYLKQHMLIHSGEKPYRCKICGRVFTRSKSLKQHMLIHSGEKPYRCKICGQKFTQSAHLKRHILIHSGEKPYRCKICGQGFTQSESLKRHTLTHSREKPYSCKVCGRGFTQSTHLKQHMLVHSGEKPYDCKICGGGFTQSTNLKQHMLVHSGEKPYNCKICGRGFSRSRNLKQHVLTHSG